MTQRIDNLVAVTALLTGFFQRRSMTLWLLFFCCCSTRRHKVFQMGPSFKVRISDAMFILFLTWDKELPVNNRACT